MAARWGWIGRACTVPAGVGVDKCWDNFASRLIRIDIRQVSLPYGREVPSARSEAVQPPREQPVQKASGRGVTVTDPSCQTVRIAAAVDRGCRGAACKSRQRYAPPLADLECKPGGIRGIWTGKRRYELSFSGSQCPLIWLI